MVQTGLEATKPLTIQAEAFAYPVVPPAPAGPERSHSMRRPLLLLIPLLLLLCRSSRGAVPPPAQKLEVPTFELRARVVSVAGQPPTDKKFTFTLGAPGATVTAAGDKWSTPLRFGPKEAEAALKAYPNLYLKGFPVILKLQVSGVVDTTLVQAELTLDETREPTRLEGELFGPTLGIVLWRDTERQPQAATMAKYNRRYWDELDGARVPPAQRLKKFMVVDRFIGGDDDRRDWRDGIDQLAKAGMSAVMLPPSQPLRELLLQSGLRRTAWAVYSPPGYAFDYDPKVTPAAIDAWAEEQAKGYNSAGYAKEDLALFAMSDEPGWYYPQMFQSLEKNPEALTRFHDYLKAQKLTPAALGATSWEEVRPMGRAMRGYAAQGSPAPAEPPLPARRLFYWTARFFSWDSARYFAACTRALEKATYPDFPVFTNFNFFSGRSFVPGPVANNGDTQSPDAAMGGHDWLEFGRMRGSTMLWTEDWFPDSQAPQWSLYCARLRCAAEKGGVRFGGYVIPRTAGDREDGILQKVLCIIGSGGKALKYFVFGPEYNFPGNCYSEKTSLLPKMAEAHRMIGAGEDLLWPGKRPRAQVAILSPRSAQLWDAKDQRTPTGIQDATNSRLNDSTVDYMAEASNLYLALQHANIPVDFVEEEDLSEKGLKPYRVLYVTEPNIPEEGQHGIEDWTRSGGTLVTVSGAGMRDRYDDPCGVLNRLTGFEERPRERVLMPTLAALPVVARGRGRALGGRFAAVGARSTFTGEAAGVELEYDDGSAAMVRTPLGKGTVVRFGWLPGLSYARSAIGTKDGLPSGFSDDIRGYITAPVRWAEVRAPVAVDKPLIESPILLSDQGAAVTLLNWTGGPEYVTVTFRDLPFTPKKLHSVRQGDLELQKVKDGYTCKLHVGAADILLLRRR